MSRVLVACDPATIGARDREGRCRCAAHLAHKVAYKREWQRAHPEKVREYGRRWLVANVGQRREIEKSWRERNPDRVKAMNARAGRKWATNNRAATNLRVKARAMAKRRAMPEWVARDELRPLYEEAARLTALGTPHEVDHIFPLQADGSCGLHVPANLQVIPRYDNRSKRNRNPSEAWPWLPY